MKHLVFAVAFVATSACAQYDRALLGGGLFGYQTGNADTGLQDKYLVETTSNPEKVYPSKKVRRSGKVAELPAGNPLDINAISYTYKGRTATVANYLENSRTTGLLVIKDGQVLFERYQYDRKPTMRFLSFSMAKTITAMLVGIALQDGHIRSLDDMVSIYVPQLKDSAFGSVTIKHLLTMTSGVKWSDDVSGTTSDMLVLNECHMRHRGCESSLALLAKYKERAYEPGARFNYSGGDTIVLAHVLRSATKQDLTTLTQERLWGRIGAEHDAAWMVDKHGVENAFGHFAASLRDYGRLGQLMLDGKANGVQVISSSYLTAMTTPTYPATRPRVATDYFGYGYQTWIDPKPGVFCMRGLKGQSIYVDRQQSLVVVRLGVGKFGDVEDERDYVWHGIRAALAGAASGSTSPAASAIHPSNGTRPHQKATSETAAVTPDAPAEDFGNDTRTEELLNELARPSRSSR